MFAETAEVSWVDLAASRFVAVPWLVLFTAGDLGAAGLELWDTGVAPHYDVAHSDVRELVASYAGHRTPGGAQSASRQRRLSDADDRSASRSQR